LTLVVPGFNDSEEELRSIARFIAGISPDIPWHVTAFHKDYKMTDPRDTTAADIVRAAEIGTEEGLHFVYAGNRPGQVGEWENTRCPNCRRTLIERYGYLIESYHITSDGRCPGCATRIPGLWPDSGKVRMGHGSAKFFERMPRPVSV
jgi:pyruvate formate lyase activating enzyme